jgi:hypothetical protein
MHTTIQLINRRTKQTRHIAVNPNDTPDEQAAYARQFCSVDEELNGTYTWR